MENNLQGINFGGILLKYKYPVEPKNRPQRPYECSAFCCECERRGLCYKYGSEDILMSHGCTVEDISNAIGQPLPNVRTEKRVMFLFENPGGDYELGSVKKLMTEWGEVTKKPPVNHYYWTPNGTMKKWPTLVEEANANLYGNYIAYLINLFGIKNAYVTNCVKCKYVGAEYGKTALCCMEHILKKEIEAFKPDVVFCFGRKAYDLFLSNGYAQTLTVVRLLHPAQRRYSRSLYFEINKSRLECSGLMV